MQDEKTSDLITQDIASVNRILPHKHKFAWDLFLKGCANNWMPTEICMQNDIKQWKNNEITEDEPARYNVIFNISEINNWEKNKEINKIEGSVV